MAFTCVGLKTLISSPVAHIPCSFQPQVNNRPSSTKKIYSDEGTFVELKLQLCREL